jgi:3-oxoacyl-(acyl-carrier-protein) synthase
MKRIVITSFDVVSSAGTGAAEFSENILLDKDYSSEIRLFDTEGLKCRKAFIMNGLDFEAHLGKTGLKHINRNSKISFMGIEKKLSGEFRDLPGDQKPGLILGTAFGSVDSIADFWETYLLEGNNSLRPLDFPNTVINAASSFINIRYALSGISATISTGFNSSLDAFIYACDYIDNGYGDFLIVGGSEQMGRYSYMGQEKAGVISKRGNMLPFGNERDGYLAGEGCAFFIVESLDHAKKRDAKIISEIVGFSSNHSADVKKGALDAYKEAFKSAGIDATSIDLISSSANGGRNDSILADVYREFFGGKLAGTSVTAHKKYFGECYGASGAIQIAACISNSSARKVSPFTGDMLPGSQTTGADKKIGYFAVDGISCEGNSAVLIFKNHF